MCLRVYSLSVNSLQVFPGNVWVPRCPGARWRAAESQDVGTQRGDPLCTELGVNEVQMCAHHNHSRVRSPSLEVRGHRDETEQHPSQKAHLGPFV